MLVVFSGETGYLLYTLTVLRSSLSSFVYELVRPVALLSASLLRMQHNNDSAISRLVWFHSGVILDINAKHTDCNTSLSMSF